MSELTSWKEIAAHLGVSERTAQNWEKRHGLPVSRMPGLRGRPVAIAEELTAWKQRLLVASEAGGLESPIPRQQPRWRLIWSYVALGIAAAAVLTLGLIRYAPKFRGGNLEAARVVDGQVAAFAADGSELWRTRFSPPLRLDRLGWLVPGREVLWAGDLNGDGRKEVLFLVTAEPQYAGYLACYSQDGKELWHYKPGLVTHNAIRPIPNRWIPAGLTVGRTTAGGHPGIWAAFNSFDSSPTVVVRFSAEGKPLGQYLHAGHLYVLRLWERGPGRRPVLLAGGINNRLSMATVVALDPERLQGVSSEPGCPDEQLAGELSRSEVFRLYLPPSRLSRALGDYNSIHSLEPVEDHLLVQTEEDLTQGAGDHPAIVRYSLTRDLRLTGSWFHDVYRSAHAKHLRSGLVTNVFDPKEPLELLQAARLEVGNSATLARTAPATGPCGITNPPPAPATSKPRPAS